MEPYEQKTPGERGNGIMRTEAGAPSPIWLEQAAAEELAGVCTEILGNARNELYLSMRFLDVTLSSLYFAPDPAVRGLGTDGTTLFFQMESLAAMYKKNRILVNRTYLHGVLHCLFCHLWNRKKRDREYWDLACDIAAESVIDSLLRPCVRIPPSAFRREFYMRLESRCRVLNAESVYRTLRDMDLSKRELQRLTAEFYADDHRFWEQEQKPPHPNMARNRKEDWDQKREKMQVEMEAFSEEMSEDEKDLHSQLAVENRERYDYRKFLRKFAVLKETVQVDPDSFDYVFYHYGMELYGNMPLIEPLETKELRRVEDFVIVIDTSMSCSGELVRQFLEETYSVLTQSETYFKKVNIHIIQCDDRVREDVAITSAETLKSYMERLTINGCGGTDFRPAFQYVDELVGKQRFSRLKGLLYFTDGRGIYPVKRPVYDTAFVFMEQDFLDVDVPPWAMKIILSPEDLDRDVEEKG